MREVRCNVEAFKASKGWLQFFYMYNLEKKMRRACPIVEVSICGDTLKNVILVWLGR
jgi:hypothetical protein